LTGTTVVYQASFFNPFQLTEGIIQVVPIEGGLWRVFNATTGTPFPGLTFGTAEAARKMTDDLLTGWRWEKTSDWAAIEVRLRKPMQRAESASAFQETRRRCIR
jgi:hypothetical protein